MLVGLATFHLSIEELPGRAEEFISGHSVPIEDGVVKDQMRPYGVCAYIIEVTE